VASYGGDSNNNGVSGSFGAEPEVVSNASPTLTTTPNPTVVASGTSAATLTDSAQLSGGYFATGTITFTLHDPNGIVVDSETVAVSGNGTYTTPTGYTLPTTGTVTGIYQWDATYSGDANNNAATDTNNPNEQAVVGLATPTLTTTASPSSVTVGTAVPVLKGMATLAQGYFETGTISFTLYNPAGAVVDTEAVMVNGNGSYTTPTGYTLPTSGSVTGTYQWVANYSGDNNNKPASDGGAPVVVSAGGNNNVIQALTPPSNNGGPVSGPTGGGGTTSSNPSSASSGPTTTRTITTISYGGAGGGAPDVVIDVAVAPAVNPVPAPPPPNVPMPTKPIVPPTVTTSPVIPTHPVGPPLLPGTQVLKPLTTADFNFLKQTLDGWDNEVKGDETRTETTTTVTAATAAAVTMVITAGYVALVGRSIAILVSAMLSTSVWRELDPLTILEIWEQKKKDDKKVEALFE
jgi:hypothetical protein